MNRMVSVRTEELTGPALDWAINAFEGDQQPASGQLDLFALPDADHLITKYGVWVDAGHRHPWLADMTSDPFNRQPGETRTIAVFRAVVFAKRGAAVKLTRENLRACQATIHLAGGFDPAYVNDAQAAMKIADAVLAKASA